MPGWLGWTFEWLGWGLNAGWTSNLHLDSTSITLDMHTSQQSSSFLPCTVCLRTIKRFKTFSRVKWLEDGPSMFSCPPKPSWTRLRMKWTGIAGSKKLRPRSHKNRACWSAYDSPEKIPPFCTGIRSQENRDQHNEEFSRGPATNWEGPETTAAFYDHPLRATSGECHMPRLMAIRLLKEKEKKRAFLWLF